ncbi:transposase [Streptomyces griseomycini]|uniref:transposase n=1 Tax=Streptomyces griseomycini TaxID=66895 RepID=UPI001622B0CB|nr:transposase [Streptomyces griseomycini]GGR53847.1 hypothetical protein GCM10015536_69000 [Streptomyces griseomycini]
MLDCRREPVQAMASRLPDGNEQNLRQLVNRSARGPVPVRRWICERMLPLLAPTAWRDRRRVGARGRESASRRGPQYCGAPGERANYQLAVSVRNRPFGRPRRLRPQQGDQPPTASLANLGR